MTNDPHDHPATAPPEHEGNNDQRRSPGAVASSVPAGRGLGVAHLSMILVAAAGAGFVTLSMLGSNGAVASPEAAAGTGSPATATATAPSAAPDAPAGAAPAWTSENRALWLGGDKKGLVFEMPALNRVQVWMKSVRPALVVRCSSKSAEVFVFTESAAKIEAGSDDHTVTFSIDDQPAVTQRWADSTDHDGLFAPDGPTFAQRLMHARTLRFEFAPHNAGPAVVHFNVNGLRDVLDPAAKECGWKS